MPNWLSDCTNARLQIIPQQVTAEINSADLLLQYLYIDTNFIFPFTQEADIWED